MTSDDGVRRLLRVYPAAYRVRRGDEIVTTLLEAAEARGRMSRRDLADVAIHGIQMRAGLTSDRFGGRVMDEAGMPGLFMGAALSVFLFIWGEWLPLARTPWHIGRFGPFVTVGPVIYFVWVAAATAIFVRPRWLRPAAALCVVTTVAMWPVGKGFFQSPSFWQLVLLVGLGLPALLAPTVEVTRRRVHVCLATGIGTFCVAWWLGAVHYLNPPYFHGSVQFSFYLFGNYIAARNLPWLALAILLTVLVLVATRQHQRAGALVVLTAPLLALAAGSLRGADAVTVRHQGAFVATGVLALVVPVVWLIVAWSVDLRSGAADQIDPA